MGVSTGKDRAWARDVRPCALNFVNIVQNNSQGTTCQQQRSELDG